MPWLLQVEAVLSAFKKRKGYIDQQAYLNGECEIIKQELQAAAEHVLCNPGLLDLVTEAELQARQDSAEDEWLPAPGSRARSKACKQLQQLREAIETNGWGVDAVQLEAFFNLPFSMEHTTGRACLQSISLTGRISPLDLDQGFCWKEILPAGTFSTWQYPLL